MERGFVLYSDTNSSMKKTMRKIGFLLAVVGLFVIATHRDHHEGASSHRGGDQCFLCQTLSTGFSLPTTVFQILFAVSAFFIAIQIILERQGIVFSQNPRAPPIPALS